MHIVIDARSRPSSTGRYIDRLLEHLQKIDSVNTYTVLVRPTDTWEAISDNFSTLVCPFKQFSFNPLDQINFARFLYKLRPDIVHFGMTPQEPLFYFGKRVTTTHDLTMLRFTRPGRLPGWLHIVRMTAYRFLFWSAHRKASCIIVPTNFVKQDLSEHYRFTKSKIVVTYESSEPPIKIKPEPLNGVGKLFILHVGSPFPHKNIERLIDSFEILKQKHPYLQLVLAGKKEFYFEGLEKTLVSNPIRNSVIIPGFVSDSELKWLYQHAAAYVLPSESEGFGLPGLEAMSHGCPLVSSNATCLPEVYGDAATYFNPLDINAMSQAISGVITDQGLRNKLKERGYKRLKLYSWEKMARETLEVYESVSSS